MQQIIEINCPVIISQGTIEMPCHLVRPYFMFTLCKIETDRLTNWIIW